MAEHHYPLKRVKPLWHIYQPRCSIHVHHLMITQHGDSLRQAQPSCCRWGHWGSERLSYLLSKSQSLTNVAFKLSWAWHQSWCPFHPTMLISKKESQLLLSLPFKEAGIDHAFHWTAAFLVDGHPGTSSSSPAWNTRPIFTAKVVYCRHGWFCPATFVPNKVEANSMQSLWVGKWIINT